MTDDPASYCPACTAEPPARCAPAGWKAWTWLEASHTFTLSLSLAAGRHTKLNKISLGACLLKQKRTTEQERRQQATVHLQHTMVAPRSVSAFLLAGAAAVLCQSLQEGAQVTAYPDSKY